MGTGRIVGVMLTVRYYSRGVAIGCVEAVADLTASVLSAADFQEDYLKVFYVAGHDFVR